MINDKRLKTFDFLRGFFIILALLEHYAYILNFFFLKYYSPLWFDNLQYPFPYASTPMPVDLFTGMLGIVFIPWVSQVYLALASFNLGLKGDLTKSQLKSNLKKYGFVFMFFTLEKFIIGKSLGEVLSLHPLQTWMIVLTGISLGLYYLGKTKTFIIGIALGVSVFIPILNSPFDQLELYIKSFLSEFSLEARPQIFAISALIGFWLGYSFRHSLFGPKRYLKFLTLSMLMVVIFFIIGPKNDFSVSNVLYYEYDWSYIPFGALTIWSTILLVILSACKLESTGRAIKVPIVNMIGMKSLWYFAFHRISFIFLYLPLRVIMANLFHWKISNTIWEITLGLVFYTLIFLGAQIFIGKSSNQEQR